MSSFSKSTSEYWKTKVQRRTVRGEQSANYYIRFRIDGTPVWFNLETGKKIEASKKAAEIWNYYRSTKDGPATLRKYRDGGKEVEETEGTSELTVGQYFRAFEAADIDIKTRTYSSYVIKLYRVISDIKSIRCDGTKFTKNSNYQQRVEAVELSVLTTESIEKWKRNYIRRGIEAGKDAEQVANTANSILRNCKALFAKKHIRKIRELNEIQIPQNFQNPFEEVDIKAPAKRRYKSDIPDPAALIKAAQDHFLKPVPRRGRIAIRAAKLDNQAYRIFMLGIAAGLRRNEIDGLLWEDVDFDNRTITVKENKWRSLKSVKNTRKLAVSDGVIEFLKECRKKAKGEFVVESEAPPRLASDQTKKSAVYYRCSGAGKRLLLWLREQGIERPQAIHELRKEFGSQIYRQTNDIFKASNALGHTTVQTAIDSYVERVNDVVVSYF